MTEKKKRKDKKHERPPLAAVAQHRSTLGVTAKKRKEKEKTQFRATIAQNSRYIILRLRPGGWVVAGHSLRREAHPRARVRLLSLCGSRFYVLELLPTGRPVRCLRHSPNHITPMVEGWGCVEGEEWGGVGLLSWVGWDVGRGRGGAREGLRQGETLTVFTCVIVFATKKMRYLYLLSKIYFCIAKAISALEREKEERCSICVFAFARRLKQRTALVVPQVL